ncbi:MAG: hypothetical protein IPI35_29640 [Deltaproteobacteria bacterium]|nr:hypothetical protein [Deltaproteobacteria bacterium]
MREVVKRRETARSLLGTIRRLDRLSLASGGYLRDLLRMVQNALRGARHTTLPITDGQRRRAIIDLANGLRKLNKRDLEVLAAVHAAKQAELEDELQIPSLSRLFDNNLLLNYRNGEEWLDAHPPGVGHLARPSPRDRPEAPAFARERGALGDAQHPPRLASGPLARVCLE